MNKKCFCLMFFVLFSHLSFAVKCVDRIPRFDIGEVFQDETAPNVKLKVKSQMESRSAVATIEILYENKAVGSIMAAFSSCTAEEVKIARIGGGNMDDMRGAHVRVQWMASSLAETQDIQTKAIAIFMHVCRNIPDFHFSRFVFVTTDVSAPSINEQKVLQANGFSTDFVDSSSYIQPEKKEHIYTALKDKDKQKYCNMCDRSDVKLKHCAKCKAIGRKIPYCGKDCQTADWHMHKNSCGKK